MVVDEFHKLFPDAGEPKLPISIAHKLLNKFDGDTVFKIVCDFQEDKITLDAIKERCHID
ncbi:MAG: hypothetical protein IKQ69_04890 [Oscillospiraceae bacterium]|nr:hypothetical protein [Oscillospiraceae bacterium]